MFVDQDVFVVLWRFCVQEHVSDLPSGPAEKLWCWYHDDDDDGSVI